MQNEGGNKHATTACDIGFIGLGVMGSNLTMNLVDHGYRVACFDLDQHKVDAILVTDASERDANAEPRVEGCSSYTELLSKLKAPHLIIVGVLLGFRGLTPPG